jgi:hypothetical protein
MNRTEQISKGLKTLASNTPDVEAAAIVDSDGLLIASVLPQNVDEDAFAAMSASMLSLGERIATELERGDLELVMTRGAAGFVILVRCGPNAVLAVLTTSAARLGLIFLDVQRAAKELAKLI